MIDRKPKITFLINHVAFFVSHRLPIAIKARKNNYEVSLLTGQAGSKSMEAEAVETLKSFNIPHKRMLFTSSSTNILNNFIGLIQLIRNMIKEKADIIHMASPKAIIFGGIAAHFFKNKGLVFAISGMGYAFSTSSNIFHRRFWVKIIFNLLAKISFKHKKKIFIVQNLDDRELLIKNNYAKDNEIVKIQGSGVDLSLYEKIEFQKKEKTILFVGRVINDKGIREFVEAVKELKNKGGDWNFKVLGAYDYQNPSSVSEKDIKNWQKNFPIEFLGHVNNTQDFLRTASIVCLPSYREGMPKALLEASAAGCAVVTTDVAGCRESIIENLTGLLVRPYDSKSLSNAIYKLMKDRNLREEMGRNGIQHAKKNFDLEVVTERILQIYKSFL